MVELNSVARELVVGQGLLYLIQPNRIMTLGGRAEPTVLKALKHA